VLVKKDAKPLFGCGGGPAAARNGILLIFRGTRCFFRIAWDGGDQGG
jgi:hypothetical protein